MKKFILFFTLIVALLFSNIGAYASVKRPISFLQEDTRWGSEPYTITGNPAQTIASGGCGPTSMAMVLNYYIDESITPLQTAIYSIENKHQTVSSGTSWALFKAMADEYDLEFLQTASSLEALEWMNTKEDPLVICSMGPGLWTIWGHFILVWDVEEDKTVHINDPYSTDEIKTTNSYDYMASQCRQYFCFNQPIKFNPDLTPKYIADINKNNKAELINFFMPKY